MLEKENEPRECPEEQTLKAWDGKEKLTGLVKGLGMRSQKSLQGFKLRKTAVPLTNKEGADLGREEHQRKDFQITLA